MKKTLQPMTSPSHNSKQQQACSWGKRVGWLAASSLKGGGAEGGCCTTPLYSSSLLQTFSVNTSFLSLNDIISMARQTSSVL